MAEHSYFEFACVCGIQYRVRYEGIYRCRGCGRILELAWSRPALEATSSVEETMGEPRQSILDSREERPARIEHSDVGPVSRAARQPSPQLRSRLAVFRRARRPSGVESGGARRAPARATALIPRGIAGPRQE